MEKNNQMIEDLTRIIYIDNKQKRVNEMNNWLQTNTKRYGQTIEFDENIHLDVLKEQRLDYFVESAIASMAKMLLSDGAVEVTRLEKSPLLLHKREKRTVKYMVSLKCLKIGKSNETKK